WEFMSRSDTSFFPGLPPGTPGALPPCVADIAFLDRETGFASSLCASGTQLFVTHDSGRTWSPQPVAPRPPHAGGPKGPPEFVSPSEGFWVLAAPQLGP